MAAKRQGRTGLFGKASRLSRNGQAPNVIAYGWDLTSDALTWAPQAAEALGLEPGDLPRTGEAFTQMIEAGSGPDPRAAPAEGTPWGCYDTRYALRLAPNHVLMVQDTGRWQPDPEGRPAFVRGQVRMETKGGSQAFLPAAVKVRSDLFCRIQSALNDALARSQGCTLIAGAFDGEAVESVAELSRLLRPMMRPADLFATLGPQRFVLFLSSCPWADALSAMTRLAGLLAAHPAQAALRLGAAASPDHTFQAPKLLRSAEKALGLAIERGERAVLYHPAQAVSVPAGKRGSFDWLEALNQRRLVLACQPVVDATSRAPALVQAMAAVPGRDGRVIPLPPVPSSDEEDLTLLADARLLELAADHLARHRDARLLLPMAAKTLLDPEGLPMLAAHLGARPGIAARLIVEIPEATLGLKGRVRGKLNALKALGVGLALSGYGTGHLSPADLDVLPVDMLKIDGVFVAPLKRSTDDRLFLRTLIDRAHHRGIAVVAEWVDDEDTARALSDWGVDYLQGAFFGEPEEAVRPGTLDRILKRA